MIRTNVSQRTCNAGLEQLESRLLFAFATLPLRVGGPGFDLAKRVVATDDGGYIVAGLFSGKVDFDPTSGVHNLTSKGDTDIYVGRYTTEGTLSWVDQFGSDELKDGIIDQETIDIAANPERAGPPFLNGVTADPKEAAEYVNDLAIGADGSVFVVGSFIGSVDFNPGSGTKIFKTFDHSFHDAFVVKLNTTNGGLVWADQFGARFTDTALSVALDSSGSIYVGGLFSRDVSFVKGDKNFDRHADGRQDAYVMKLSTKGKVRWVSTFGGGDVGESERDSVQDIAVDAAGNVYAAGCFAGKADFDPSATGQTIIKAKKSTDAVLVKYNTNGKFLKVVTWDGGGFDGLSAVTLDSGGNPIIAGYFEDKEFEFDPGSTSRKISATPEDEGDDPKFTDLFVEKLNKTSLSLKWMQQLQGGGTEFADEMKVDSNDNIIIGGSFYDVATFGTGGPTLTSAKAEDQIDDSNDKDRDYSYDPFLWKMDSSGATAWARSWGRGTDDFGGGISPRPDGSIFFAGRYRLTTDFDPSGGTTKLPGEGLADGFVTGFDADGNTLF